MRAPDEPRADGELPLPPRPAGEVVVPPLRPSELRRELRRLQDERERAQLELGGLVAEMARQGALAPALLADGAATVRSRQDQIDAIASALGDKAPIAAGASSRRATVLAALLAVGILGAVAGAWIERRHDDSSAAPVTALSIVTETVTTAAVPAAVTSVATTPVTTRSRALARPARGGHAIARGR
jgi:hypothetical protein